MNDRRKVLVALGVSALAAPFGSFAQRAKVWRIGFLGLAPASGWASQVEALRAGLRELGYFEGKNIVIEFRWAATVGQFPELAAELVRMHVDVIIAPASTQVEPARQATKTIPIVFAQHADPVGTGHVASLGRPGGNITGVSMVLTEIAAKLKIELVAVPVQAVDDFEGAFSRLMRERVAGFLVPTSPLTNSQPAPLAELALRHRLPGMFGNRANVAAGGLMSYGADFNHMYRRAAVYVDKILKGFRPAELPVERASKYYLVINRTTANTIGVTIPQSILVRTDEVIG